MYRKDDEPDDTQFEDYLESGKAMMRDLTLAESIYVYLELK